MQYLNQIIAKIHYHIIQSLIRERTEKTSKTESNLIIQSTKQAIQAI